MKINNSEWSTSVSVEKGWTLIVSLALLLFLVVIFFNAESSFDVGDGVNHFLISKYSWLHPELFLDSWGKPFFTLVSSAFSQFGLKGMLFFNALCGVLTGYFAYLILKKLKIAVAWPVLFFVVFAPGYFPVLNSGLTEPLFGLMLLISIYLILLNKTVYCALLLSFLPFVRTEGFLIVLVFIPYLLYERKFNALLCLGTGTLVYSMIGFFVKHDFFWIINQNPYDGKAKNIYGSGKVSHFFLQYDDLTGKFILLFGILSLVFFIGLRFIKAVKPPADDVKSGTVFYLVGMSFIVYFLAHVIMWNRGWANSLGLIRPIAAVLPCISLLAYFGFYKLIEIISFKNLILKAICIVVGLFYVVKKPFTKNYYPFKNNIEQKVISDAVKWLKKSKYAQQKMYVGYPYFALLMDVDLYDRNKAEQLWSVKPLLVKYGVDGISDSSLIILDSHFGPECRISKNELMQIQELNYVSSFNSLTYEANPAKLYFDIDIFYQQKLKNKPVKGLSAGPISLDNKNLKNSQLIKIDKAISNDLVIAYTKLDEYGPVIQLKSNTIPGSTERIKYKTSVLNKSENTIEALVVMVATDQKNTIIGWEGRKFNLERNKQTNEFKALEFEFLINQVWLSSPDVNIEFYIWNKNKNEFFQQDLTLDYIE